MRISDVPSFIAVAFPWMNKKKIKSCIKHSRCLEGICRIVVPRKMIWKGSGWIVEILGNLDSRV